MHICCYARPKSGAAGCTTFLVVEKQPPLHSLKYTALALIIISMQGRFHWQIMFMRLPLGVSSAATLEDKQQKFHYYLTSALISSYLAVFAFSISSKAEQSLSTLFVKVCSKITQGKVSLLPLLKGVYCLLFKSR